MKNRKVGIWQKSFARCPTFFNVNLNFFIEQKIILRKNNVFSLYFIVQM